jgi:hypothetical protein
MGPGAITPDKDIKTASIRKADNNNFYSLVGRNYSLEKSGDCFPCFHWVRGKYRDTYLSQSLSSYTFINSISLSGAINCY